MDWVYILIKLIFAFVVMNVALVIVAYLVYFERKVSAFMQNRLGPNRAGPRGLFQSFADLIKMLRKEETIPGGADRWVFWFAPVVSTFASLGALAVLPFGPGVDQHNYLDLFGYKMDLHIAADVGVGALVVLAMSSLGVYGVIMSGWSANSKYSLLGGLRASSQVISYEITLGTSLVGVFLLSSTLNLNIITMAQDPYYHSATQPGFWFILLQPVAFITFFTSAIAETNRTPFDLPEAESELVGGYHTEYSGIRFGLMFLSEYIGMLTVSVITSVCFLGGWSSPFALFFDPGGALSGIPVISGLLGSGIWWIFIKIAAFIFIYYWLRWTLPRFRYDQLMGLCWKVFIPIILLNIVTVAVLKLLLFPPGTNPAAYSGWSWLILVIVELVFGVAAIFGFSRIANLGWFGKAERPLLVEEPRQVILVRTVHGGAGTIKGEARPVEK